MAVSVVKKSGEEEDFQRQKIVESCISCGAPRDVAEKIGDEIENSIEEKASTEEIRSMVLEKLGNIRQEWADSWKEYEESE